MKTKFSFAACGDLWFGCVHLRSSVSSGSDRRPEGSEGCQGPVETSSSRERAFDSFREDQFCLYCVSTFRRIARVGRHGSYVQVSQIELPFSIGACPGCFPLLCGFSSCQWYLGSLAKIGRHFIFLAGETLLKSKLSELDKTHISSLGEGVTQSLLWFIGESQSFERERQNVISAVQEAYPDIPATISPFIKPSDCPDRLV